jgi:hypothetical protein
VWRLEQATAEAKLLKTGKMFRSWVMALTIVWRNPFSLVRFTRTLERTISNELGAVYAVTAPDLTQEFEVIPGDVAGTRNVIPAAWVVTGPFELVDIEGERIIGPATLNRAICLKKCPNATPAEFGRWTYMLRARHSNRQRIAMETKWLTESPESRIEDLDPESLTELSRLQRLVCELLSKNRRLRMKLIAEGIPSGPDKGSASFEVYAVDL